MGLELDLQCIVSDPDVPDATRFVGWIEAALGDRREATEVVIRIVDSDEGQALNATWRGRDRPTNVLAFPADLPPALNLPLLGDLVLCAPVVTAEAREQGKSVTDHYAHLTIHGLLHLLGFDHEDESAAVIMEAEERRILAGLGIADPYQDRD